MNPSLLNEKWQAFHEEHPGVTLKDAALHLGTSELELVATFLDAGAVLLNCNVAKLGSELTAQGKMRFVCSKPHLSLEEEGTFAPGFIHLDPQEIKYAIALREERIND